MELQKNSNSKKEPQAKIRSQHHYNLYSQNTVKSSVTLTSMFLADEWTTEPLEGVGKPGNEFTHGQLIFKMVSKCMVRKG